MPLDLQDQTRRHGDGWEMFVGPTNITIVTTEGDESSEIRAFDDLASFASPRDWVLEDSGFYPDGRSYFEYSYYPE